ncbi:uncharacterized protein LOC136092406 isoform X1 [Hydra vulgaris]|uniref:Uncharacterized protein LOC136092406 isoform X1 n=2 Tax=Hydra vulgaris TaxID=6087 RepID=A0ABM4DQ20_HYDVU
MVSLLLLLLLLCKDTYQSFTSFMVNDTSLNFKLVAFLKSLPKEYKISFELQPNAYKNNLTKVIHFTNGTINYLAEENPGVGFTSNNQLYFRFILNGTTVNFTSLTTIPLNVWTKISISQIIFQQQYIFTINISDINVYRTNNALPQELFGVKVYLGDPLITKLQPGNLRNLVIENTCEESFTIVNDTPLKRFQLVTNLTTVPKEYHVSFDLLLTSFINKYTSILHLTIGGDASTYGDRNPGLWLSYYNSLYFSSSINGYVDFVFDYSILPLLNDWMSIAISQLSIEQKYIYTIELAGNQIYTIENNIPMIFNRVNVYLGDPWYDAQPGFVRNLIIKNSCPERCQNCKPLIKVEYDGFLINRTFLKLITLIAYIYEPGEVAYNVSWQYTLPPFAKIVIDSEAKEIIKSDSIYMVSGAFMSTGVLHNINLTLDMTSSISGDFFLDIPLRYSFENSAGYPWSYYKTITKFLPFSFIAKPIIARDRDALEESYGRGACFDELESLVYVCMNLYVKRTKVSCFYSKSNGATWSDLDLRVGSVLGYHNVTRDLYAVHRNQKTYLLYHNVYKKWLAITNDSFKKEISDKINQNACKPLEGSTEKIYTFFNYQWMGNQEGFFFRKYSNESWIQRIKWNNEKLN